MSNPQCILIVDDVPLFRELGALFLARSGCEILTAAGSEEALAIVRNRRPALVLTDFHMPGMNGAELCRAIKGDLEANDTPVIVVLGRHDGREHGLAIRAGADATLEKPLHRLSLIETVNRFIRYATTRGLPRANVETPISMEVDGRKVEGTLRNVSRGGVFVETSTWIGKQVEIGLRFQLPETGQVFSPTAQVVWSSQENARVDLCGVGMQFLDLDRTASRSLEDFVFERTPVDAPGNP